MERSTWKLVGMALLSVLVAGPAALTAQETEEGQQEQQQQEDAREVKETKERRIIARDLPRFRRPPRAAALAARLQGGGYLGVAIEDVDEESAAELELSEVRGAHVTEVRDGSPAAQAGLESGDVIVRYNDEAVESVAELTRLVRETPPGRRVTLGIVRDGSTREMTLEVGERERDAFSMHVDADHWRDMAEDLEGRLRHLRDGDFELDFDGDHVMVLGHGRMGVRLQSLGDQLAEYFGVGEGSGALVASVREESPAAEAGLRAGDVIVRVGDTEVEQPRDVVRAVREAEAGPLTVTVIRRGEERSVTVELPERDEVGVRRRPRAAPTAADLAPAPAPGPAPVVAPGPGVGPRVRAAPHAPRPLPAVPAHGTTHPEI